MGFGLSPALLRSTTPLVNERGEGGKGRETRPYKVNCRAGLAPAVFPPPRGRVPEGRERNAGGNLSNW